MRVKCQYFQKYLVLLILILLKIYAKKYISLIDDYYSIEHVVQNT